MISSLRAPPCAPGLSRSGRLRPIDVGTYRPSGRILEKLQFHVQPLNVGVHALACGPGALDFETCAKLAKRRPPTPFCLVCVEDPDSEGHAVLVSWLIHGAPSRPALSQGNLRGPDAAVSVSADLSESGHQPQCQVGRCWIDDAVTQCLAGQRGSTIPSRRPTSTSRVRNAAICARVTCPLGW
jgi:hypothetical protein